MPQFDNESKVRKILFNEIFLISTIIAAILSPVIAFFSIKTEIAVVQNTILQLQEQSSQFNTLAEKIIRRLEKNEKDIILIQARLTDKN